MRARFPLAHLLFAVLAGPAQLLAQPSGGPYGPLRQLYDLPKGGGKTYFASTDGTAAASGDALSSPTSIDAAIGRARSGDVIVLRGGTYRTGNLKLNQGITIQPYRDEQPLLKGTMIASAWKNLSNGLWTTKWARLFPSKPASWWQRDREGKKTPLHRFNNDMVFIDGRSLQSAGWEGEVTQDSYYIDYDDSLVYIGTDPTGRLVEITAFDVAILRTVGEVHGRQSDRKGYVLRGLTITQYAYRALEVEGTEPEGPSEESKHGKEVVGTTLENCTISFCSRVAGYLRGDRLTMRQCRISDTSTEGIYIIASSDVLLEKNIFMRNNIEGITGYYPAAVKIFNQSYRVTCRDNLVTDLPYSNGIWYDVGNVDGVFVNNWIENVGSVEPTFPTKQLWPSQNGFFFEISKNAICAGNVFVNCDHGLMVLNSSHVQIYQNTFVNSMACIGRNARTAAGDRFGWHPSTGPDIDKREGHVFVNNLLTGDKEFTRSQLFVWQSTSVCQQLTGSQLQQFDNNVFVREIEGSPYPLVLWSPAPNDSCQIGFETPEKMGNLYPGFSKSNQYYPAYDGPVFKGVQLGNYEILASFPGSGAGTDLPTKIKKLVPGSGKEKAYVGAYPPER